MSSRLSKLPGWFKAAFTENLHLKAISLVLSLVLFVIVRSDREIEVGTMVALKYSLPKGQAMVDDPVREVRITVSGARSKVRRLLLKGLEPIEVDLRNFAGGTYYIDERSIPLPRGIRLVAIQPSRLDIDLEPKARRSVPVSPNLVGTPDPAFKLVEVNAFPRKVDVVGPESKVAGLEEVKTLPIDMDGRWESTELMASLSRLDPPLQYNYRGKIRVRLTFEPRYESRVFDGVPVEAINTSWRVKIRPSRVNVSVEAPVRMLPGLDARSFKAVVDAGDLEGKPAGSRHRLPVEMDGLPDTVRVIKIAPPRVLVRLLERMPPQDEPPVPMEGPPEPVDAGPGVEGPE